ncbi:MAG: dienelactone hydrolase family protein [Bacteroidia bacterium]|nr:dienelactone hydrolase family protein [Bacteroidia bacterium]
MLLRVLGFAIIMVLFCTESRTQPCAPPDQTGSSIVGWNSVTLQRSGRTLNCRLYYPAVTAGQNSAVAVSSGPYPMIAFGHGFAMQTSYYNSYYEHLASHGYIVIAPQFPDTQHGELAQDLLACLDWLRQRNSDAQHALYGAVDTSRAAVSGHSMGGGASLLAASYDSRIKAAAPMCPAETTPSVIARMGQIAGAVCIIAGSNDGITPLATHQQPMYNAALPGKSLAVLQGGNHTRCMDTPLFDFTDPGGGMTRPIQKQLTRRYMTALFNLFLKDDSCGWSYSYGINASHPSVSLSSALRAMTPSAFSLLAPLSGLVPVPAPLRWQRSRSLNPSDSIRYTVQTSSNASFSPLRYETTLSDTTFQLPAMGLDTVTYWRVISWTAANQKTMSSNVGRIQSTIPVRLTSFSARRHGSVARLQWVTESEENSFGFEVQRSTDGASFAAQSFVLSKGNGMWRRQYSFDDTFRGAAWYRLRQVDFGGQTEIFGAVFVPEAAADQMDLLVTPNIARSGEAVTLRTDKMDDGVVEVSFWARNGSRVAVTTDSAAHTAGNTGSWVVQVPPVAAGFYLVVVKSAKNFRTGMFIVR